MPSDREGRERRRQVIREILKGDQPVVSQRQLVELLKERGIEATQASISRDLQDMNAIRVKGRYSFEVWTVPDDSELLKVEAFIRRVRPATQLVVVKTTPGTAAFVARGIEATRWPEIVGTLAGDDTVFIAQENVFDRNALIRRLKRLLDKMEPEPQSPLQDAVDALNERLEEKLEVEIEDD